MFDEDRNDDQREINYFTWNDGEVENGQEIQKVELEKSDYITQTPQPSRNPQNKNRGFVKFIAVLCAMALCISGGYFGGILAERSQENISATATENASTNEPPENTDSKKVINTSANVETENKGYTLADIVESTAATVVEITTETVQKGGYLGQYVSKGAGSGVIITTDGYIITNNHVIDGASTIKVKLKDNDKEYEAELIGKDAKTDIAVIKISGTDFPTAIFGDSDGLKVGEDVIAIGNPLGSLGGTVTNGIISALGREIDIDGEAMTLLQTNAAINPGNSGGGLFDMNGKLIGVVNAKSSGSDIEGLGFAIPSNVARSVAEDLMNYGYVKGRIGLGMTLVDITDTQTAMMYRVQKLGVYILQIENKGSAKEAGLQSGDCILMAGGKEVDSYSVFTKIIDSYEINDTIEIVVYRNRQEVTCTIKLQEYIP